MIYLDNAATSFPKPSGLSDYMSEIIAHQGGSFGRGGYSASIKNFEDVLSVRLTLAKMFSSPHPQQFIFTKNATEGLNAAIFGVLSPGDRVIVTPLEHNSVMRPLNKLGCKITTLPLNEDGSANVKELENLPTSKMVILNHASNVSGIINDVEFGANYCKAMNIPLLIDASQSAGHIPLSTSLGAMIACAGHKGLLGPQGTGVLYIPPEYQVKPFICGGTGGRSELIHQPEELPDKFESGTLNSPAILGLGYSLKFIEKRGMENIHTHEMKLVNFLTEELSKINGIHILYPENTNRTPVISFYAENMDTVEFGTALDRDFGIAVRCGLHCAPSAHKAYGTLKTGTVRVSPGPFTKFSHIEKLIYAVNKLKKSL